MQDIAPGMLPPDIYIIHLKCLYYEESFTIVCGSLDVLRDERLGAFRHRHGK